MWLTEIVDARWMGEEMNEAKGLLDFKEFAVLDLDGGVDLDEEEKGEGEEGSDETGEVTGESSMKRFSNRACL